MDLRLAGGRDSFVSLARLDRGTATREVPTDGVVPVEIDAVAAARIELPVLPPHVVRRPDVGQAVRVHRPHHIDLVAINQVTDLRIGGILKCEYLNGLVDWLVGW